jgi:hypothetical protein
MYVYYGVYHFGGLAQIKIGQTSNIQQRTNSLYYRDCIIVEESVALPRGCNCLAHALFVESYLRMKLLQYKFDHPALGMIHISTDYFKYNSRYYGIMEKNFKHLFFKWVNEAIEIIQNNA